MISRTAIALLVLYAAGVFATEYNCDAEGKYCQNGGICHDTVTVGANGPGSAGNGWVTPECICSAPYAGPDCGYTIRECKDSPCKNGATCMPADCTAAGGAYSYDCFKCVCPLGWTGTPSYSGNSQNPGGLCDYPLPINDCSNNQCLNGGTCTCNGGHCPTPQGSYNSAGVGFTCACPLPYHKGGDNGGAQVLNCTYNCNNLTPCQNGGTCITASGSCTCPAGYWGNQCEFAVPCTAGTTCQNGGTCVANSPTGACLCPTNSYWGTTCENPPFCSVNTCLNGATCLNSANGAGICECPGFPFSVYGPLCQPAFCLSNPCMNGGTCTNGTAGTGTCSCPKGFIGTYCEIALPGCGTPEIGCAAAHTQAYSSSAPTAETCKCVDSTSCTTNNFQTKCECQNGYNSHNANQPWGYYHDCRCNSTHTPLCPNPQASGGISTPGVNVDAVCQNGGTCIEWAGGMGCQCRPGFWGTSCQNYDNPCLNGFCKNGGHCYIDQFTNTFWDAEPTFGNLVTSYYLALDDRYWSYTCQCKYPYYGTNCENVYPSVQTDVCAGNACMNGATCGPRSYGTGGNGLTMTVGNFLVATPLYQCTCSANFTGPYCETAISPQCTAGYCMNGGFCTAGRGASDSSKPGCTCPCGYAGDRCEVAASNMAPSSVATLANDGLGGVGYYLDFCSSTNPCQNGATCVNYMDGQTFICLCKTGWGDRYCQTAVRSAAAGLAPSAVVALLVTAVASLVVARSA